MFRDNNSVQSGNAMMIARIMQMPDQPLAEGQFVYRVVETRGRKSGEPRQVPLAVFRYQGQPYLIAPALQRDWVANLNADGHCTLIASQSREPFIATRVTDAEAAAAALAYRQRIGAGFSGNAFPFGPGATLPEVQRALSTMAIFRLTPEAASTTA